MDTLDDSAVKAKIQKILDEMINPAVASHGGFVSLLDVKENFVYLMLGGGCQGCGMVNVTLKQGIEATLKQVETAQWHPMATRGDYQIGANLTGLGPDDPDANFYENYGCGSPRNYSAYCSEQIQKMIDAQSQELDPKKRMALVGAIQRKLEDDAARPVLGWRLDYFTVWPHVKNLVPHQSIFNWGRMQEVWRDS